VAALHETDDATVRPERAGGLVTSPWHLPKLLLAADPAAPPVVREATAIRASDAAATRSLLQPWLAAFGITRVADLTGLDVVGIPVHSAVRPLGSTVSAASGKGLTTTTSWLSAVMEGIEQHVWEAVPPTDVIASEDTMVRFGASVCSGANVPRRVGAPWSRSLPVRWREGFDVVSGACTWVPDGLVTAPPDPIFVSGSNGLASGSHVLEALLAALLEVIERDGLTWAAATRAPATDPLPLLDLLAPELSELLRRAGAVLEVVDATTDVGVPTYRCHLWVPGDPLGTASGSGAATDAATALVRAVVEAAQTRTVLVAGTRDDVFTSMRRAATRWPSRFVGGPPAKLAPVVDAPQDETSLLSQAAWVLGRLVRAGFDRVAVLRHTEPGDPVQVVRAIVPGLEGYPAPAHQLGERGIRWRTQATGRPR
jgi:YcaO-like protein with predicted kinase domain